jgi:hypothetical protein
MYICIYVGMYMYVYMHTNTNVYKEIYTKQIYSCLYILLKTNRNDDDFDGQFS